MFSRIDFAQLAPAKRAELIYSEARSELSDRLWRAALGKGDAAPAASDGGGARDAMSFDALLAMLDTRTDAPALPAPPPVRAPVEANAPPVAPKVEAVPPPFDARPIAGPTGLGPNARHLPALSSAAARTGIPVTALAAIVHAEAAKNRDGSWQAFSRNPRSSAAGLGQFLSGTWAGMAETRGTWLNDVARSRGWLGEGGRVLSGARSALLQLRYDPAASIETTADYARQNLDGLAHAGVSIGTGAATIARSAYLGHHLGLGDAVKFMKGGLDAGRARVLLNAQVGTGPASRHIAAAGDPATAHRAWFMDFVQRNIRPERFAAS